MKKGSHHTTESKEKLSLSKKDKNLGNTFGFQKGRPSWNKGKKGLQKNHDISGLELGHGWNKGMKGIQIAWNKGIPNYAMRGENHPLWKGEIRRNRQQLASHSEYKEWHKEVLRIDNYTCQLGLIGCFIGRNLQCHHIKRVCDYPKLIHSISNGITLCKSCHLKIHWKEKSYEKIFRKQVKMRLNGEYPKKMDNPVLNLSGMKVNA